MANRFPLIVDSSALQIKELPSGDNLDLTGNSITGVVDITASGDVSIGGTLTYQDVSNVDSVGLITERSGIRVGGQSIGSTTTENVVYYGDGSNLSGLPQSGVGIQSGGTVVGYGITTLKFVGTGNTFAPDGTTVDISISGGGGGGGSIATERLPHQTLVVTLDLTSAQDHKITATGIVTVTTSGGTEGESHTVRVVNSGIANGWIQYILLVPIRINTTDANWIWRYQYHFIHCTQNRSTGTQLLAGSSLNFSFEEAR